MSFWNDPQNNPLKVLIFVALLAIVGYFAFTYFNKTPLGGQGLVMNTSQKNTSTMMETPRGLAFAMTTNGKTCSMIIGSSFNSTESVTVEGTVTASGDCKANTKQSSVAAQNMAAVLSTSAVK